MAKAKNWLGLNESDGYFNKAIGEDKFVIFAVVKKFTPNVMLLLPHINQIPLGGICQCIPIGYGDVQLILTFENIFDN